MAERNSQRGFNSERWTTQVRKGILELSVLNVIDQGPVYGYEIAKRLSKVHEPQVREGTVYPILSRLKKEGLLKATIEESAEGPPRKYYALTSLGRSHLKQMNQAWDQLHHRLQSLRRSGS